MGLLISAGVKHPMLSIVVQLVVGFLTIGLLLVWFFTGFGIYTVLMLSPSLAASRHRQAASAREVPEGRA
jgi:hypothetical protein